MVTLTHYLVLSAVLIAIGVAGIFLNRKNVILLLMCIELMLLAVNFNFIAFSRFLGDTAGQVFVFFILTVAAAEAVRRQLPRPRRRRGRRRPRTCASPHQTTSCSPPPLLTSAARALARATRGPACRQ